MEAWIIAVAKAVIEANEKKLEELRGRNDPESAKERLRICRLIRTNRKGIKFFEKGKGSPDSGPEKTGLATEEALAHALHRPTTQKPVSAMLAALPKPTIICCFGKGVKNKKGIADESARPQERKTKKTVVGAKRYLRSSLPRRT